MAVKVYPERRMRDEHPFKIWQALQRLRVMDKLAGVEDRYYSPSDICNVLYSNWQDLDIRQTLCVLEAKINYAIRFLKIEHYIEERMERSSSNSDGWFRYDRPMDEYRILYSMDSTVREVLGDRSQDMLRDLMDDSWGVWIGRPVIDVDKILEKYA